MNLIWMFVAFTAGAIISVQTGINMTLTRNWLHQPILAGAFSCCVAALVMIICVLVLRLSIPPFRMLPLWQYSGGVLGAYFVVAMLSAGPRIGAVALIALVLAGQMIIAVVLDHFGLFGYPLRSVSVLRILGLVLIGVGVFMVRRF